MAGVFLFFILFFVLLILFLFSPLEEEGIKKTAAGTTSSRRFVSVLPDVLPSSNFLRQHIHHKTDHDFLLRRIRFGDQKSQCSQTNIVDNRDAICI